MNAFELNEDVLDEEEYLFIRKLYDNSKKDLNRVFIFSIILAALIPIPISLLYNALKKIPTPHLFYQTYLISFLALLFFTLIILFFIFEIRVKNLMKDVKHKLKIIEQVQITQKKYVPFSDTYHFYINSTSKLSIEVSKKTYDSFDVNDELNIEYSKYAKEYFAYF
jgi:hypothetical protein